MAHPEVTTDYTSGSSADAASFSATNPARQIMAYGAGSIVVIDNAPTPASVTYTVNAGDVLPGEWTAFTSTTCSRIRITTALGPIAAGPALPTIVPATQAQSYVTDATTHAAAFSCSVGYQHMINVSGATFAYTLPPITAAVDGQRIAIVNVGAGTTATVAIPTGSDAVGNATGSTGATAAGPTTGAVKVYCANNTLKQWLVGI